MLNNLYNFSSNFVYSSLKPLAKLLYLSAAIQLPSFVNSQRFTQKDFTVSATVSDLGTNELSYSITQKSQGGWLFTWANGITGANPERPQDIVSRTVDLNGNLGSITTITFDNPGSIEPASRRITIEISPNEYLSKWNRINQAPLSRYYNVNSDTTINILIDSTPRVQPFMHIVNLPASNNLYAQVDNPDGSGNSIFIGIFDTASNEIFSQTMNLQNGMFLRDLQPLAYLGTPSYCPGLDCFVACWRFDAGTNQCRIFDNNGAFVTSPIFIRPQFGTGSDNINYFSTAASPNINENWYFVMNAAGNGFPRQALGFVYSNDNRLLGPIQLLSHPQLEQPQIFSLPNGYLAFFAQIFETQPASRSTLQLQILNQNLEAQTSFINITTFPSGIAQTLIQADAISNSICVSWSRIPNLVSPFSTAYQIKGIILQFDLQANNLIQQHTINEDENLQITAMNLVPSILNNDPTVSIQLSNPNAGEILTETIADVSSTYNNVTGLWQVTGNTDVVNVFHQRLQFSPAINFNGNLTLAVTINDGFSITRQGVIDLEIIPINDPPEQTQALPVLVANVNIPFSQTVNFNNYFADVDNAFLNFQVDTGSNWFSFDNATNTFSGMPSISNFGQSLAFITIDDLSGGQINQTLIVDVQSSLMITNSNYIDTFIEDSNINLRTLNVSTPQGFVNFSLSINDPNIAILSQPSNLTPTYDQTMGRWSVAGFVNDVNNLLATISLGIPEDYEQTLQFNILANDNLNPNFNSQVTLNIQAVNDAPRLINPLINQNVMINQQNFISIPTNTFFDPDLNDTLTLVAQINDSTLLPSWFRFLANEQVFIVTPDESNLGSHTVIVDAIDSQFASTRSSFVLTVEEPVNTSDTTGLTMPTGNTAPVDIEPRNDPTPIVLGSAAISVTALTVGCVGVLTACFCFFGHKQKQKNQLYGNNNVSDNNKKQPFDLINN